MPAISRFSRGWRTPSRIRRSSRSSGSTARPPQGFRPCPVTPVRHPVRAGHGHIAAADGVLRRHPPLRVLLAGAREADARPLPPCGVNEALNRPAARSRNPPFSITAGSGSYSPILCPLLPGRTRVNVLTARFRPRGEPPAPGEAGLGSGSGEGVAAGGGVGIIFAGPASRSAANLTVLWRRHRAARPVLSRPVFCRTRTSPADDDTTFSLRGQPKARLPPGTGCGIMAQTV